MRRGRSPEVEDFTGYFGGFGVSSGTTTGGRKVGSATTDDYMNVWPPEPLFSNLIESVNVVEMPRLVRVHPEMADAASLSILSLHLDFAVRKNGEDPSLKHEGEEEIDSEEEEEEEGARYSAQSPNFDSKPPEPLTAIEIDLLASDLTAEFTSLWSGASDGGRSLDGLFGFDHGLLDLTHLQLELNADGSASKGGGLKRRIWITWWHLGSNLLDPTPQVAKTLIRNGRMMTPKESRQNTCSVCRRGNWGMVCHGVSFPGVWFEDDRRE